MTNDLTVTGSTMPATLDEFLSNNKLVKEMTGQQDDTGNIGLPELKLNQDAEYYPGGDLTQDPVSIPRGHYKLRIRDANDVPVEVYAKSATFRPLLHGFRYAAYNNEDNEYVNESSIFKGWNDVVFDKQGNEHRAGEYKKKVAGAFPTTKCSHVCFGTVSMDAVDADGNKHSVKDVSCMYCPKGSNFMSFDEALKGVTSTGKLFFNHTWTLTSHREQNGSNIYYASDYKLDKKEVEFGEPEFELLKYFDEGVGMMNKYIHDDFQKNRNDPAVMKLVADVSGESLDKDFEDELPF